MGVTKWWRLSAVRPRLTAALLVLLTGQLLSAGSGASTLDSFGKCLSERTKTCDSSAGHNRFIWSCIDSSKTFGCEEPGVPTPVYSVLTKEPVQFTIHPESGIYINQSTVILTCGTQDFTCLSTDNCPHFRWHHNNDLIGGSQAVSIINNSTRSVLRIRNLDQQLEGRYTCVVQSRHKDNMFTIRSFPATVTIQQPSTIFSNWSNESSQSLVTSRSNEHGIITVDMTVPVGASVVLDCTILTPSSSDCHIWSASLSNNTHFSSSTCLSLASTKDIYALPSGNLVVYNFNRGLEGTFLCILQHQTKPYSKKYNLVIKNDSTATNKPPKFLISPQSQIVAAGNNVTFYCIAEGDSTHITYVWSKDGWPIRNEMSFGPSVLFLVGVTVGQSGNYSCSVTASRGTGPITRTASLRVLGPLSNVSINVVPSSTFQITATHNGDILLPPTLTSGNFTLECSLPSSYDQGDPHLKLMWLFRGEPVSNDLMLEDGNRLVVLLKKDDVRNVFGSVQCLVEGTGGRGSASVRILEDGKPNPPGPIVIHKLYPHLDYDYRYKLNWTEPSSANGMTSPPMDYQLQVILPLHKTLPGLCTVNVSSTCLVYDGMCNIFMEEDSDEELYPAIMFRTAAVSGGTSDYSIFDDGEQRMQFCLRFQESLPQPPVTHLQYSLTPHFNQRVFTGTLSWHLLYQSYSSFFTEEDEKKLGYVYGIHLSCDGQELLNHQLRMDQPHNQTQLPALNCLTNCTWYVTLQPSSSDEMWLKRDSLLSNFVTPAFAPNISGYLQSLRWSDSSGEAFELVWLPPEKDLRASTCTVGDLYNLTIHYQHMSNINTVNISYTSTPGQSHQSIRIPLNQSDCWTNFTVSVTYSNPAGSSPPSNALTLPSPQPANISGFSFVSISNTANGLRLSWVKDKGLACFVAHGYITYYRIYLLPKLDVTDDFDCSRVTQVEWNNATITNNFPATEPYYDFVANSSSTSYCLRVGFLGKKLNLLKVWTSPELLTTVRSTTSAPPTTPSSGKTHTATSTNNQPINTGIGIQPMLIMVVVMLPLFIAVLSVGFLLYCLRNKLCRRCKRTEEDERLIPEGSIVIPKVDSVIDKQSEHTQYNLLERFLEDTISYSSEQDLPDCASTVSGEVTRGMELNKGFAGSSQQQQTVEVELHNFDKGGSNGGDEREIDEQTGRKTLSQNLLEKRSRKIGAGGKGREGGEPVHLKPFEQPHVTINRSTVTMEAVKRVAEQLVKQDTPSTSCYEGPSCLTTTSGQESIQPEALSLKSNAAMQRKSSTMHSPGVASNEAELAQSALSNVLALDSSQPLWQAPAAATAPTPLSSMLRPTATSLIPTQSLSLSLERTSLPGKGIETAGPPSHKFSCPQQLAPHPHFSQAAVRHSQSPSRFVCADGYITEECLARDASTTTSILNQSCPTTSLMASNSQTTAAGPVPLVTGDDYLPHPPLVQTEYQPPSLADSAVASITPVESLSQASSEQSVFLPESEPEPPSSFPSFLPPPPPSYPPGLARIRSDCSSGVFSSPASPATGSSAGYLKSESLYSSSSQHEAIVTAIKKQPLAPASKGSVTKQVTKPLSSIPQYTRTMPQPWTQSAVGSTGMSRHHIQSTASYNMSSATKATSHRWSNQPIRSFSSSSTFSPQTSVSQAPKSMTRLPSLTSVPPSPNVATNSIGSSCKNPYSSHGPSFLSYMYSVNPSQQQRPTSMTQLVPAVPATSGVYSTATIPGSLCPPHNNREPRLNNTSLSTTVTSTHTKLQLNPTSQGSSMSKREELGQHSSSLSSLQSFDSSYSPSSSLDDLTVEQPSSPPTHSPSHSHLSPLPPPPLPPPPPPPAPPPVSVSDYSNTSDLTDMWDAQMILTVEELAQSSWTRPQRQYVQQQQ